MNLILKTIFGSRLYGTDLPDSDTDYKGIYLPKKSDLLLSTVEHHKQFDEKDQKIDFELMSLHKFLTLACEGQTMALDMVFTPLTDNYTLVKSRIWEEIQANRHLFLTKKMKSFVGYAKAQATKYGVRGRRLEELLLILTWLRATPNPKETRLWQILSTVPADLPHYRTENHSISGKNILAVYFLDKCFHETVTVQYVLEALEPMMRFYGDRTMASRHNHGVDWKAIYHSFRVAYELRSIYKTREIVFPLPEAEFLRVVRQGKRQFSELGPQLDDLIDEVEEMAENVNLPEKADRALWDSFILSVYEGKYGSIL